MTNLEFYGYTIECLTNIHVGSGDSNYDIIDKKVQRDSISHAPIINATSLKGAFREYFEESVGWKSAKNPNLITYFGSDKGEQTTLSQGKLRFIEAKLLSIPVRGIADIAYYRATSIDLLTQFNAQMKNFGIGIELSSDVIEAQNAETEFENFPYLKDPSLVGDSGILMNGKLNNEVLKQLPIIARNSLENGQSDNLWYEEFVPRESRFYFFIGVPKECKNYVVEFEKEIDNKIIQIGANATVGYGYCKLTKISQDESEN